MARAVVSQLVVPAPWRCRLAPAAGAGALGGRPRFGAGCAPVGASPSPAPRLAPVPRGLEARLLLLLLRLVLTALTRVRVSMLFLHGCRGGNGGAALHPAPWLPLYLGQRLRFCVHGGGPLQREEQRWVGRAVRKQARVGSWPALVLAGWHPMLQGRLLLKFAAVRTCCCWRDSSAVCRLLCFPSPSPSPSLSIFFLQLMSVTMQCGNLQVVPACCSGSPGYVCWTVEYDFSVLHVFPEGQNFSARASPAGSCFLPSSAADQLMLGSVLACQGATHSVSPEVSWAS